MDVTLAHTNETAAPGLLHSLGFRVDSSLTRVAVDLESQRAVFTADSARFVLPTGCTLRDCHAAELAPLCRHWYSPDRQSATLAHIANARNQSARALYQGPLPVAFVFYDRTPEALTIDLWAAAPSARGSRANLTLITSLIRPTLTDGTRELHFAWTTGTRRTPTFAHRYCARALGIQDHYVLPLLP